MIAGWSGSALAANRFVDPAGIDNTACMNPANPCQTIDYAITQSAAGDDVFLSAGTYNEHSLIISHDLNINGAGQGVTIIDAQTLGRHFTITGLANNVLFRELTLTNGNALAVAAFEEGGALLVTNGSLEIVRTEIIESSAFNGGAISCDGCTDLTVRESRLVGNAALEDGGAINTDAVTNLVANSTISQNTADANGGGVHKVRDSLTLRDSEIVENESGGDGGGLYSAHDDTKILRSAFIGNSALGNGGGVSVHGSQLVDELLVLNSTFSANTASSGGAVDVGVNNPAALGNVTMVDNLATAAGQADDIESSSALVTITLSNSILTHPTVGGLNPECGNAGVAVTMAGINNLIDTNASCLGSAAGFLIGTITPFTLGTLNFHGGLTRSYSLVDVAGNNAVDNPVVGQCLNPRSGAVLERDQRSRARPVGAGALCDIGSFELQ